MSVKRYANFLGAMVEAPGSSYNGYMKYVLDEDYAALEEKRNELARIAVEFSTERHRLEAELRELKAVLADIEQKGHKGGYHGKGYSLANIAESSLKHGE